MESFGFRKLSHLQSFPLLLFSTTVRPALTSFLIRLVKVNGFAIVLLKVFCLNRIIEQYIQLLHEHVFWYGKFFVISPESQRRFCCEVDLC